MQTHQREVYGHFSIVWTAKTQDKSAHRMLRSVRCVTSITQVHSQLTGTSLCCHLKPRCILKIASRREADVGRSAGLLPAPRGSETTRLPEAQHPHRPALFSLPSKPMDSKMVQVPAHHLNTNSFDRKARIFKNKNLRAKTYFSWFWEYAHLHHQEKMKLKA